MSRRRAGSMGVLFLVFLCVASADSIGGRSVDAGWQELPADASNRIWQAAMPDREATATDSAGEDLGLSGRFIPEEAPRQIPPEPNTAWLLGSGMFALVFLGSVLIRARCWSRFARVVVSADAPIATEYARLWRFFHDPDDDYNRPYWL